MSEEDKKTITPFIDGLVTIIGEAYREAVVRLVEVGFKMGKVSAMQETLEMLNKK